MPPTEGCEAWHSLVACSRFDSGQSAMVCAARVPSTMAPCRKKSSPSGMRRPASLALMASVMSSPASPLKLPQWPSTGSTLGFMVILTLRWLAQRITCKCKCQGWSMCRMCLVNVLWASSTSLPSPLYFRVSGPHVSSSGKDARISLPSHVICPLFIGPTENTCPSMDAPPKATWFVAAVWFVKGVLRYRTWMPILALFTSQNSPSL
mmetsp:Transcript_22273/g.58690  ORF Transcript_22273/g.58690 Transcript_22273/m.58690 type:complete len:207 (+) Transcript_22273:321-941(+)